MSADDWSAPSEAPSSAATFWRSGLWWRRAGISSASYWVANALGFATTIVAARGLGPEHYGEVILALSICSVTALFLDFTLEEALIYFGTRDAYAGNRSALRRLFRTALAVDVAIGVVITIAVVALATPLSSLASGGDLPSHLIRIAALSILVATADGTTGAALSVASRPDLRMHAMLFGSLTRLGLVALAVQGETQGVVVVAIVVGMAVSSAVQAAFAWHVAWRRWPPAGPDDARIPVGTILRFSFHSSITSSLTAANASVVPIVLGRTLGTSVVAQFHVATAPLQAAGIATAPLRLAVAPGQRRACGHEETGLACAEVSACSQGQSSRGRSPS